MQTSGTCALRAPTFHTHTQTGPESVGRNGNNVLGQGDPAALALHIGCGEPIGVARNLTGFFGSNGVGLEHHGGLTRHDERPLG